MIKNRFDSCFSKMKEQQEKRKVIMKNAKSNIIEVSVGSNRNSMVAFRKEDLVCVHRSVTDNKVYFTLKGRSSSYETSISQYEYLKSLL